MFRAGLYARISTNDQQTLAMQNRAMREYAARRREIDLVLVWHWDRWDRSATDSSGASVQPKERKIGPYGGHSLERIYRIRASHARHRFPRSGRSTYRPRPRNRAPE